MSAVFPPPGTKVHTISEINRQVNLLLGDLPTTWVVGEVSNFTRHAATGYWFLKLKDANSRLAATVPRGVNLRIKFELKDGMKVIACGRLGIYFPRGEFQLQIEALQPEGIGPLELAFRQLKEKLSAKGYFDSERKKPVPTFPRRIVLVTSPSGAAVRDMLEILGQRWPAVDVWICPVPVQGDGAAEKIAEGIRSVNRLSGIDLIIIARGGGSLEDLWAFNEECVAHAIYESRIPIISGVGHETDLTIADLVADRRAETPSAAAMTAVRDWRDEEKKLRHIEQHLRGRMDRQLETAQQRLNELVDRPCFRRPLDRIRTLEERLDDTGERLTRAARLGLERAKQHMEAIAARLETLSPLNVLARGYSLTRKEDDQSVVRRSDQVRPGERIVTLVQAGRLISRVEEASAASADSHG
jgi:exodeoxyribonuclease VII large subunit